jgi:hypothetical protein
MYLSSTITLPPKAIAANRSRQPRARRLLLATAARSDGTFLDEALIQAPGAWHFRTRRARRSLRRVCAEVPSGVWTSLRIERRVLKGKRLPFIVGSEPLVAALCEGRCVRRGRGNGRRAHDTDGSFSVSLNYVAVDLIRLLVVCWFTAFVHRLIRLIRFRVGEDLCAESAVPSPLASFLRSALSTSLITQRCLVSLLTPAPFAR